MQAAGTTHIGTTGPLHHRTGRTRHPRRGKPAGEDLGAIRERNPFLTARFAPIFPQSVTREWNGGERNYLTRKNYEYLLASAMRYAELMNAGLKHDPGACIGEGISNLYDELNKLTGGINLNIEIRDDKLVFVLWKSHKWGDYTFYWLPVRFTEKLDGALKRIAVTFIHDLQKSNGMYTLNNMCDAEMTLEWVAESLPEYNDKEERDYMERLINSYNNGRAFRLMQRIEKKRYYKNLPAAIERYVPKNVFEERLTGLFREGLQFIGDDKPSIMSYGYDPLYEENPNWEPVELERLVRIIYDPSDCITEWLEETVNNDLRESYDISPVTSLTLSPECDELFTMDDYPERFSEWFERVLRLISE